MPYHGRTLIEFVTSVGKPGAGYIVQVRSLPNKKRRFEPLGDRLYMQPLDPKQLEEPGAELTFYNTMLVKGDILIVANGVHTDGILKGGKPRGSVERPNFSDDFTGERGIGLEQAEKIMRTWRYEPDSMATPRVALVRWPDNHLFAIATKYGDGVGVGAIEGSQALGRQGRGLPTYTTRDGNVVSLSIQNSGYLRDYLIDVPVVGNTAEEIAGHLYNSSGENLIVAAAAAVFENGEWNVAFKNRFGSLEEFETHKAEKDTEKT
ncbi:MAG: hypothetical protein HY514_03570 [Candidatus Aenigmarchaeota archaeon]|nr:hypothetical protein [Candidatus Aenigmarchaeota archaeon]